MKFWQAVPTWLVSVFTAAMLLAVLVFGGVFSYGRDLFLFWFAFAWVFLGAAELLRRAEHEPPPDDDHPHRPPWLP